MAENKPLLPPDVAAKLNAIKATFQAEAKASADRTVTNIEAAQAAAGADAGQAGVETKKENGSNGHPSEMPNFAAIDQTALLEGYAAWSDVDKTKHIQKGLSYLGRMREEIYQLGGLGKLKVAVEPLVGKNLIERSERERIKSECDAFWKDKQPLSDSLASGELVKPLQEVLVEAQRVLEEVRAHGSKVDQKTDEVKERVSFPQKLERLRTLVTEWGDLHQNVPESRHGAFHVAIKESLGLEGLIRVSSLPEWLDEKEKEHHWKGSDATVDKRLVGGRLNVLEKMVAMAKEKLPEFTKASLDRAERTSRSAVTGSRSVKPTTEDRSAGTVEATPTDPIEAMHAASREAQAAYAELVQLLESHPDIDVQAWFDGPTGREELPIRVAAQKYFDQVGSLTQDYEKKKVTPEAATNILRSYERRFSALRKRFLESLPDSGTPERQQKQLERDAERLGVLQDIVARFNETYNDFHLSEDRPTNRQRYERYGNGDKAEAGKIILPPLDEDAGVVANPRELLKQGVHDIYAEFLLAATPEKLQASAQGKGVEGARRFEAHKNRLMNLYNKLWAQIEVVNEMGNKKSMASIAASDQSRRGPQMNRDVKPDVSNRGIKETRTELSPDELRQLSTQVIGGARNLLFNMRTVEMIGIKDANEAKKLLAEMFDEELPRIMAQIEARVVLDATKRERLLVFLKKLPDEVG